MWASLCKLVAAKQMPLVKLPVTILALPQGEHPCSVEACMPPPAQSPVACSCHCWNKQTEVLILTGKPRVENPVLLRLLLSSDRPVIAIAVNATQVWFSGCVLCTVDSLTAWELHTCVGQPPISGSYQVEKSVITKWGRKVHRKTLRLRGWVPWQQQNCHCH